LTLFPQIQKRIRNHLNGGPGFSTRTRQSYRDFISGNPTPFVELLEDFFRHRATRSLADADEPTLVTVIELLWFEEKQCAPQMRLLADPTKKWGDGRHAFVDIFVGNSQRQLGEVNPVLIMELKNVSLLSLWKARQQFPRGKPNSNTQYNPILDEVREATEDQLLDLKYTFEEKSRQWVTLRVKDTLRAATAQLDNYISIMLDGQGGSARRGVFDQRVLCRDGGDDVLCGYVIICVAGTRVICRHTATRATEYLYTRSLALRVHKLKGLCVGSRNLYGGMAWKRTTN